MSLNFKYKLSENAGFVDSLEEFETKATFVSKLKADKGFGAIGKVSLQTAQVSLSSVQCNFRTYEINIFHRL